MNLAIIRDVESAVTSISAAYLICDLNFNVITTNLSADKYFEFETSHILNQNFICFLDEDENSDLIMSMKKTASDGIPREVIQENRRLKEILNYKISKYGSVILIEISDQTDIHKILERERVEISRNQAVLENIDSAVICIDFINQTIISNQMSFDYFGDITSIRNLLFSSLAQISMGKSSLEKEGLSNENDEILDLFLAVKQVWQSDDPKIDYVSRITDSGNSLILRKISRWDFDGKPRGVLVAGRDITNEVSLKEIQSRNDQLAQIQKFAQGIAHDFGNLSQSILGFTKLLIPKVKDADGKVIADNLLISAERALSVSKKISEISRIQVLKNHDFNLLRSIEEQLPELEKIVDKNVDLELLFDLNLDATVHANPDQLERIVQNIVENANCAMAGIGKIKIHCYESQSNIIIEITNTGPAIPKHIADRMFMPFVTSRKEGGTGLGLYLAYEYLNSCGGAIELKNQSKNVGFKITLPRSAKVSELDVV